MLIKLVVFGITPNRTLSLPHRIDIFLIDDGKSEMTNFLPTKKEIRALGRKPCAYLQNVC